MRIFIHLTKYWFYPDACKSLIAYFGKHANIRNLWNVKIICKKLLGMKHCNNMYKLYISIELLKLKFNVINFSLVFSKKTTTITIKKFLEMYRMLIHPSFSQTFPAFSAYSYRYTNIFKEA